MSNSQNQRGFLACICALAFIAAACGGATELSGLPTCEEVLAAAPGTHVNGCFYENTPDTIMAFGFAECGTGMSYTIRVEGGVGNWWATTSNPTWIELGEGEITADFIQAQCG